MDGVAIIESSAVMASRLDRCRVLSLVLVVFCHFHDTKATHMEASTEVESVLLRRQHGDTTNVLQENVHCPLGCQCDASTRDVNCLLSWDNKQWSEITDFLSFLPDWNKKV